MCRTLGRKIVTTFAVACLGRHVDSCLVVGDVSAEVMVLALLVSSPELPWTVDEDTGSRKPWSLGRHVSRHRHIVQHLPCMS